RCVLARRIARDLGTIGSPLTLEDLNALRALEVRPLALRHSLVTVYNMTPPTQGVISLAILGVADRLGLDKLDPLSADYVHLTVEATKQAFRVRDRHVTDPAYMKVEAQSLLAPERLDELAAQVDAARAYPWGGATVPGD